ncbi:MAG: L-rhamnose mutarotase [Cytophagales bacterium]|nr:L-rhamnose mutarotase [Cytophagales bacterium]
MLQTLVMVTDLKDDDALIAQYEEYHRNVWPEIVLGIKNIGVIGMDIYRAGNRLVMLMTVPQDFDFSAQMATLASMPMQNEWENLMWKYQQALPFAKEDEKWVMTKIIFKLS